MFQAGEDVAAPCNHHRTQRNLDAVAIFVGQRKAGTTGVSLVSGSCATRIVLGNTTVGSSRGVRRSSILSNANRTHFTPSCSSAPSSSNITPSNYATFSASNSAQPVSALTSLSSTSSSLFTSCIQTLFTPTPTETLVTISATLPPSPTSPIGLPSSSLSPISLPSSSASPIGLTSGLGSSTSTDVGTGATSFVSGITLSTIPPLPSPPFSMSNSDSITLPPVSPSTVIGPTQGPSTIQSSSDTTLISSISSIPFIIPTLFSSTFFSPTPSTSTLPTISYPSISAISLSSIPTITLTRTLARNQTITVSSVETATLSSDSPHNAAFAHQTGAIIGVGIAGTFILFLLILLLFFACKRRRSNRSHNSPKETMPVTRNALWRPPLEADDDDHYLATYGRPNYPNHDPFGNPGERGLFGTPLVPPVAQTRHGSMNPLPWWDNTEPLNVTKRSSSQAVPRTVDSHITADSHMTTVESRSASSLGYGGGSSSLTGHLSPGSSGEALVPRYNGRTSISDPRPIHSVVGRSTPPTAFVLGRDPSVEYGVQRVSPYQRQDSQRSADARISQTILARLRASRIPSHTPTMKTYSSIGSEELVLSRASSYISPSLLNPPISLSQTAGPRPYYSHGVIGSHYSKLDQARDAVSSWPDATLPFAPSPVSSDTSSMVEGLLHPRLGRALGSQHASSASLRDHEDYTRPINGLVNNHIRSTTTFDTQDSWSLAEAGA